MSYLGNQPVPHSTRTIQEFTVPSGGQTTFATAGYVPNFIQITLNGIRLAATDYTATNGSDVVLTTAAVEGDVLCVDMQNELVDVGAGFASTSEVQGTHTTFSGSHSDTATTINLASVSGISARDYVVGEGIATGTTVSSVGASSVVISAGLDTDGVGIAGGEPISFYNSTKALSPGTVAGGLCRAWVNFNGTGTVAIRAAYNVSSISDNGIGDYQINLTTAMPDANYCTVGTTGYAGNGTASGFLGANRIGSNGNEAAPTTTAVRVNSVTFAGSVVDTKYINVSIFR